jgi:hypothetical protein
MRNEAKYMLKQPVNINGTRYCLKEDDTDLRVTICHIGWGNRFGIELTFCRRLATIDTTVDASHCQIAKHDVD